MKKEYILVNCEFLMIDEEDIITASSVISTGETHGGMALGWGNGTEVY